MTTLVLLPGMDGTGTLFGPFLQALPRDLPFLVMAYPSQVPLGYAELESFAISALPSQGPLVLLGESFSGPIAASLAAKLPGRVRGLILCCTFVRNPQPGLAILKPFIGIASPAWVPARLTAKLLLGHSATAELRALFFHALAGVSSAVLRTRLRAITEVNAEAALSSVKAPVLYLQATQDKLVPTRAARLAAQACPDMRVVPIEGPHCLLQVSPVPAAAIIAAFVRETEHPAQH